jgi:hypothetical protein
VIGDNNTDTVPVLACQGAKVPCDVEAGVVYSFSDPPDFSTESVMEFRLIYYGPLIKATGRSNARAWEKHQIRLTLHEQIKSLWNVHPILKFYRQQTHVEGGGIANSVIWHHMTQPDAIARHYEGFVPVVNGDFGMFCELEILFLRAEPAVLKRDAAGGDLDNRIKTLLDALCIPQRGGIARRSEDPPDPEPIFVLLSDDSLVTSLRVTADRLLTPATNDSAEACVIIHANVKTADPLKSPYGVSI